MTLSVDVANQAIQLIGDNQPAITGSGNYPTPTFDNSPAGLAAAALYVPCVDTVGREFGWDFSRNTFLLVPTGLFPPFPWGSGFAYYYPMQGGALAIQIRQIIPASVSDPNNPLPLRWSVANDVGNKVILTNVQAASAVISNRVTEDFWDAGFREAVVRLLASEFAMALAGRPDTAQRGLEAFQAFEGAGEARTEN